MLGPLFVDLKGFELDGDEIQKLRSPIVGGVILFSRNFESVVQLQKLNQSIRNIRPEIIIGVDQEGGRVQRFKNGFSRLPPLQKLGQLFERNQDQAINSARELAWLMAAELRAVGVDISFAPVVDVDDFKSDVIGDRSFANDSEVVSILGKSYMEGMAQAGMAATLKHFPGHGCIQADSHVAQAIDHRAFAEIELSDMAPFKNLLPLAQAVMPAHIQFTEVDDTCVGFSKRWLQTILREQLKFEGVIFSDDLSMEGAAIVGNHIDRAKAALDAGCDAILLCNQPDLSAEVLNWLTKANWQPNNKLAVLAGKQNSFGASMAELQFNARWQNAQKVLETVHVF